MSTYSLQGDIASLAIENTFTKTLYKVSYELGKSLLPFHFLNDLPRQEAEVIDLAGFNGIENKDITTLEEVGRFRANSLNMKYDETSIIKQKLLFIDYLLACSVCYIEVPILVTLNCQQVVKRFDKFLATKNLKLLAHWLGCTEQKLQAEGINTRISLSPTNLSKEEIRLVKLTTSKTRGNSKTIPKNAIKVENMTCIPVFMLNGFLEGIEEHIEHEYIKFTYLKDNGAKRTLVTTLDTKKIAELYQDSAFVSKVISHVMFFDSNIGAMKFNTKQNRGYIQLPEVGASKYDDTGTRALNLARILKIEKLDSIDTSFINIDLEEPQKNFEACLGVMLEQRNEALRDISQEYLQSRFEGFDLELVCSKLHVWLVSNINILSTEFKRYLHKEMIKHKEWFPIYTGERTNTVYSVFDSFVANSGLE